MAGSTTEQMPAAEPCQATAELQATEPCQARESCLATEETTAKLQDQEADTGELNGCHSQSYPSSRLPRPTEAVSRSSKADDFHSKQLEGANIIPGSSAVPMPQRRTASPRSATSATVPASPRLIALANPVSRRARSGTGAAGQRRTATGTGTNNAGKNKGAMVGKVAVAGKGKSKSKASEPTRNSEASRTGTGASEPADVGVAGDNSVAPNAPAPSESTTIEDVAEVPAEKDEPKIEEAQATKHEPPNQFFSELQQLRDQIIDCKLEYEKARDRVAQLESENNELKKQLAQAKSYAKKCQTREQALDHERSLWQQRWEDGQKQLEECWKRFDALQGKFEASEERRVRAETRVEAAKASATCSEFSSSAPKQAWDEEHLQDDRQPLKPSSASAPGRCKNSVRTASSEPTSSGAGTPTRPGASAWPQSPFSAAAAAMSSAESRELAAGASEMLSGVSPHAQFARRLPIRHISAPSVSPRSPDERTADTAAGHGNSLLYAPFSRDTSHGKPSTRQATAGSGSGTSIPLHELEGSSRLVATGEGSRIMHEPESPQQLSPRRRACSPSSPNKNVV